MSERDEKKTVRGEPRNQRERRGRARERTRAFLDVPLFRARVSLSFFRALAREDTGTKVATRQKTAEKILSVFVAFFHFLGGRRILEEKTAESKS